MIHNLTQLYLGALAVALWCTASTQAAIEATVQFHLEPVSITVSAATFDVDVTFTSTKGNTNVQAIQLSVVGSSPQLTYNRFGIAVNPAVLPNWSTVGTIGLLGLELITPNDPTDTGSFLQPSGAQQTIGTLTIDLTGIASGTSLNVTLAGGSSAFDNSDVAGDIDGTLYPTFRQDPGAVLFSQPNGLDFMVPPRSDIPEPTSILAWIICCLLVPVLRFRPRT